MAAVAEPGLCYRRVRDAARAARHARGLTPQQAAACPEMTKVRGRCRQLSPFTVKVSPARVCPGGLACPVSPAGPLSDLHKITGDACIATGHQVPAGPELAGAPCVVVAYAAARVPDELAVISRDGDITMQLSVVQLVRVRFDGPQRRLACHRDRAHRRTMITTVMPGDERATRARGRQRTGPPEQEDR
jgi:hypothetical protein